MRIKTKLNVTLKQHFSLTVIAKIKKILVIFLGKVTNRLLEFERAYKDNNLRKKMINLEKTPIEKIELMSKPASSFNPTLKDYGGLITADSIYKTNTGQPYVYDLCAKVLENFIKTKPNEIKKVVQIGCGALDVINEYLSSNFENIEFVSNDLMVDLEEIHKKEFINFDNRKNWNCISGHQVELLKKNILNGDLIFSKSILCAHSPKELDELFSLYKKNNFSYIFIAEKWQTKIDSLNIFKLEKPEDIKINKPYVNGYLQHNYFDIFNKNGYDVVSSNMHVVRNSKNNNFNLNYYLFMFAKLK